MKKLVSFVLATVLCLGMTTAVMATESPTTAVTPVGDKVTIEESYDVTPEQVKTVLDQELGDKAPETVLAAYVFEIVRADNSHDGMTIQLNVNGAKKGETWVGYAYNDNTQVYDLATATVVADGIIEIVMPHFSELVLVKTANAPTYIYVPYPVYPEETSPKTADVMVGLYAVAALTGTVVAARKVKKNK